MCLLNQTKKLANRKKHTDHETASRFSRHARVFGEKNSFVPSKNRGVKEVSQKPLSEKPKKICNILEVSSDEMPTF